MIRRPLWTLPISFALVAKLKDAGYEFVEDVQNDANAEDLKQLIPDDKFNFENFIHRPSLSTGLERHMTERSGIGGIITFSKAIDDLFEGGIPTCKITEVVGAPGSGKTQLCLQLCVSVQIPEFIGGISGSVVYISSNNNFSVKRVKEIHASCTSHCTKIVNNVCLSNDDRQVLKNFVQNEPFSCITRYNVETLEHLRAAIFNVQKCLETSKRKIRLLIIDSFTFPFYSTEANLERTRRISNVLSHLIQLASSYQLAVILVNDLTTLVLDSGLKEVVPSLGETFAHAVHNRLVLGERNSDGHYTALLTKSSEYSTGTAYFQITDGGIRDVPVK